MGKYSPAQWRCFDRCLLGLKKYKTLGVKIRFLTFTLPAVNAVYKPAVRSLDGDGRFKLEKDTKLCKVVAQNCFRLFYKRLKRLSVVSLVEDGYISEYDAQCFYGDGWRSVDFSNPPYFCVRTGEGNGVLHVVLACEYIPFNWIMEQWVEIAGTCYIWINDPYSDKRFVRFRGRQRDPVDVAHYLMSQYVGFKQPDFRYGWSKNWVYDGFSRDYDALRRECRSGEIVEWIYCKYNIVVYRVDVGMLETEFGRLMDKHVYGSRKNFDDFMAKVKHFSETGCYYS